MGILGRLLGSDSAIKEIANGVDKSIYTAEEKADMHQKNLELYKPFKVAQRLLALNFCVPWVTAWTITFIASFFTDVTQQKEMVFNQNMFYIIMAVVTFYFSGGTIESFKKVFKK